jgi:hypothetical protein
MAQVRSWINGFAKRHSERFPHPEWPKPGSEFWLSVERLFARHGVTEAVADEASLALMESPPAHLDRHAEALLSAARTVFAAAQKGGPEPPGEREAAQAASRGCGHCGGQGHAVVFRPVPRPSCSRCGATLPPDHLACPECEPRARPVPRTVAAHCVCPYGRWVRSRTEAEMLRRFPDLAEVLAGRSVWLAEDPDVGPVPESMTPLDAREALRALIASRRPR